MFSGHMFLLMKVLLHVCNYVDECFARISKSLSANFAGIPCEKTDHATS